MSDPNAVSTPAATPAATPVATPAAASLPAQAQNPLLDMPDDQIPKEWLTHVRELRRENATLRDKAKSVDEAESQKKLDDAVKAAVAQQKAESDKAIKDAQERADRRTINAEVRATATKLGIVDMDAVKLLDTSKLTIDQETGEVVGADALLAEFKAAKPFLFKEPVANTSSTGTPPRKQEAPKFDARTATPEERNAQLARIARGEA